MEQPKNLEQYTDKYFLRAKEILEKEELNPFVRAQVFIRKGPGRVYGIDEAIELIQSYCDLDDRGVIWALPEGAEYSPKETLMLIEARIQDIVALETLYLGIISSATTKANDGIDIDLAKVEKNMKAVVDAAQGRPVSYFGARHWHWNREKEISFAAYKGGASSTATDIGAAVKGQKGIGTIPHALENIYAWKYGKDNAVVEATKAFDRVISEEVPRIALIDYNNREVDDALATAFALDGRLNAVRIDTCGENIGQEASLSDPREYWGGSGVRVSGVYAVRKALDENGFQDVKIILSSGFGNVDKINAFIGAEEELGVRLFDGLGVGSIYQSRAATMDIVSVGEYPADMQPVSKVGREYKPNPRLELKVGMPTRFYNCLK